MAIAVVGTATFADDGNFVTNTNTIAATRTFAAGSLIHVYVGCDSAGGAPTFTASDNASLGTWSAALDPINDTVDQGAAAHFWCYTRNGGAATVTVTLSANHVGKSIAIEEFSGGQPVGALAGHNGQTQAGVGTGADAVTSGTFTPPSQPLMVSALSQETSASTGVPNAGTGFTSSNTGWGFGGTVTARSEFQRVTSVAAVAGTFTGTITGRTYNTLAAGFFEAGAGDSIFDAVNAGPVAPNPRRRHQDVATWNLTAATVFAPAAWFDAPPVDRPKPSRRPPDEPTWNQTATAFIANPWYEAQPEARGRPWRRPPQEPTWDQAPLSFTPGAWFESSEAVRSRQPHKPFYEDPTWNQTLLAPSLSATGWMGSAPDRPVGPKRSPYGEGDIGASPQLATFASVDDAPIRPRPPLSRALQPTGAFTLPSAFAFLNPIFVEGSAPSTGRGSRGPRLPEQWNLSPVFVALPWFDAPDGVTGRRPRAHGDDAWAPPPTSPWWGPQDADKPRNRRPLAPEIPWDQPQAPFPLPFFQGAEAERSRQPRSPSTETTQPWGSAILFPSTGWDTDPVIPIRWPHRPGSDVSAVGTALVFIPQPPFYANDPLPKYHRPGPGETAGPVGTFIVTLAASALDNQQASPPKLRRPTVEDGAALPALVSLLPFFDSAEVARMRAARRPIGVDGPVLFVPPALAEEPAVVRRRALRVVTDDPTVLPPFVAPFAPAPWADLVRDPSPRPTRQGTRAPSWSEWPGPPFVPPSLGTWLDLSRDPTGRGTVVHPDHNSDWTLTLVEPTPPLVRPATSLLLLGVQAQPARASQFSLTLRALMRDVEEDPHSRVVSGARSFVGPEVALPLGSISAIRFLVVQPTAGSTLVLHLSSPALGTASVPLRGPVVWRCAEGGSPLTRVSVSGSGAARWALAGD